MGLGSSVCMWSITGLRCHIVPSTNHEINSATANPGGAWVSAPAHPHLSHSLGFSLRECGPGHLGPVGNVPMLFLDKEFQEMK